ncbi:MAG: hypothetical protein CFE32_23420, partial [Alphaproteobacteria bacterium PA3]
MGAELFVRILGGVPEPTPRHSLQRQPRQFLHRAVSGEHGLQSRGQPDAGRYPAACHPADRFQGRPQDDLE